MFRFGDGQGILDELSRLFKKNNSTLPDLIETKNFDWSLVSAEQKEIFEKYDLIYFKTQKISYKLVYSFPTREGYSVTTYIN